MLDEEKVTEPATRHFSNDVIKQFEPNIKSEAVKRSLPADKQSLGSNTAPRSKITTPFRMLGIFNQRKKPPSKPSLK